MPSLPRKTLPANQPSSSLGVRWALCWCPGWRSQGLQLVLVSRCTLADPHMVPVCIFFQHTWVLVTLQGQGAGSSLDGDLSGIAVCGAGILDLISCQFLLLFHSSRPHPPRESLALPLCPLLLPSLCTWQVRPHASGSP